MIKTKVKNLKTSSTLRINEISKELEAQGKEIFKFGFGQSPFKVPEDVVIELRKNSHQNIYLPVQGLYELRSSIANMMSKNDSGNSDNLFIKTAYLDEGPVMKRFRPAAMGRATGIRKRTSHLTIIISNKE